MKATHLLLGLAVAGGIYWYVTRSSSGAAKAKDAATTSTTVKTGPTLTDITSAGKGLVDSAGKFFDTVTGGDGDTKTATREALPTVRASSRTPRLSTSNAIQL